jgi:hypothetical protein
LRTFAGSCGYLSTKLRKFLGSCGGSMQGCVNSWAVAEIRCEVAEIISKHWIVRGLLRYY